MNRAHIIGVGGAGCSAIARYFLHEGYVVTGSDNGGESTITRGLAGEGVRMSYGDDVSDFRELPAVCVYSSAVPGTHPELVYLRSRDVPCYTYPQYLGEITKHKKAICISGTHGKSTTTVMTALVLQAGGLDPMVIVGTQYAGFEHRNFVAGSGDLFVVEACEHEAHMLGLHPYDIVLGNIEADHLDYYGDLEQIQEAFGRYVGMIPEGGMVIAHCDDANIKKLPCTASPLWYGAGDEAQVRISDIRTSAGETACRIRYNDQQSELVLRIPGTFNLRNAAAALAVGVRYGVPLEVGCQALRHFMGVWRRFEVVGMFHGAPVVSDYAHHPTAVRETIAAARAWYPGKKIIAVFEPHQHHRTRALFGEFVAALETADKVILHEIYSVQGRESDEVLCSSQDIAQKLSERKAVFAPDDADCARVLSQVADDQSVVLVMGAGRIDGLARRVATGQYGGA